MTIRRFLVELSIACVIAVIVACATTPDGFSKLASHLAHLAG